MIPQNGSCQTGESTLRERLALRDTSLLAQRSRARPGPRLRQGCAAKYLPSKVGAIFVNNTDVGAVGRYRGQHRLALQQERNRRAL